MPTSGRPAAPALSPAQVAAETAAGQSIDAFGLDLYRALQSAAGGSGNMLVSPTSISTALAMAFAGARGETAAQMAKMLHLSGDPAEIAHEFGTLLADLNSAGQSDYALSVADALWGQQGMQFLSQFLDTMQTEYGGRLNEIDFASDPAAARKTINDWVAQQTNDKIQNFFPSGSINALTRLVLANAIYFKGRWATGFDAARTQDASFTLASGAVEQAPTMHGTEYYSYMESDGFQVVELPYAGGRLVMDVLLPSGNAGLGVSSLPSDLNRWLDGLRLRQVSVSLPKFKFTTQFNLGAQLQALGMTDAFGKGANFSGMTDPTSLHISQVLHKAYIGVDETGAEAAAATGLVVGFTTSAYHPPTIPIQFNADHPFLFVIRDTQSGSVLFMGQVANPLQDGGDSSAPGIPSQVATSQPGQTPPAAVNPNRVPTPDINHDGQVTPADALHVINYLIRRSGQSPSDGTVPQVMLDAGVADYDVNQDGQVSASDALFVINALLTINAQTPSTPGPVASPTAMAQPSQSVVAVDPQMASAITLSQNVVASNMGETPELGAAAPVAVPALATLAVSASQPQLLSATNLGGARLGQNRNDLALALTGNWSPLAGVWFDESDSP